MTSLPLIVNLAEANETVPETVVADETEPEAFIEVPCESITGPINVAPAAPEIVPESFIDAALLKSAVPSMITLEPLKVPTLVAVTLSRYVASPKK